MSWRTQFVDGDTTHLWSPWRSAERALTWADEYAQWLTTDQATLMRYVPEQQQALAWRQHTNPGERADIADVMPRWLQAAYGLVVESVPEPQPDGLSTTALYVRRLCLTRSRALRSSQVWTVDPAVQAVLATLATTEHYSRPDPVALAGLPEKGIVVLPHPMLRSGPIVTPAFRSESDGVGPLRAIAWLRETTAQGPTVRVLDLSDLTGKYGRTGDAAFDSQVRQQLGQGQSLPPLMFSGEASFPAVGGHDADRARQSLTAAGQDGGTPWLPDVTISDSDEQLAAKLLSALADSVTAPLFHSGTERVSAGKGTTRKWGNVTVLSGHC